LRLNFTDGVALLRMDKVIDLQAALYIVSSAANSDNSAVASSIAATLDTSLQSHE
jgi:hypothetical protein